MIRGAAPTRVAAAQTAAALLGLAGAIVLRAAAATALGTSSVPAGLGFAAMLLLLAVAAGWRPAPPRPRDAAAGLAGGMVLVALPVAAARIHGTMPLTALYLTGPVLAWAAAVAAVGVAEEAVFRGVLQPGLARLGVLQGVLLTAALFGLLHVPFYGWGAFPVDAAAGVWLGWLRQATGSVAAPAVAHVVADWSTWLLR